MRLGNWRFKAGLWPTLAMLLLCALFLRLGAWQWQRAAYKRGLLTAYATQAARPPVSLDALLADPTLESLPQYLRVSAQGRYDGTRQLLLEDITHEGQVGYEVLTPFLMQGDVTVLVDRGWVAATAANTAPEVAVPETARRIEATVGGLPVPGLKLGKPAPPPLSWPKVLFYPAMADLRPFYGPKLMTPVLHLDPKQPDGYLREWSPDVGFPPERHLAYAFQWAALALAVFGVWLVVNLRRNKRESEKRDG
jgi:surfeit locus 1 family protein